MDFKTFIIYFSYFLSFLCIALFLFKIAKTAFTKLRKNYENNEMRLSNWIFYCCDICAFILLLGFRAELLSSDADYGITALFGVAILACLIICIVQCNWKIRYYHDKIIFTDSFGVKRNIPIQSVSFFDKNRLSGIYINNNYKIKWDTLLVDTKQEINLHKFYKKDKK